MAVAEGVWLNHISRATPDVKHLAQFYQEVPPRILGFERIQSPNFADFEVIWLKLPGDSSSTMMHLIERNPESKLPEEPELTGEVVRSEEIGSHVSFTVENYDEFVNTLKEKGIGFLEFSIGERRQGFFSDPDGNCLEVMES
ncbi:hypothetical protein Sjap_006545 [Stephania japonica]|uniref:VOC domain-containing protein n=1 Tax=Stephania japonica TaxID=461633 RepID=A0AAP0K8F6_9MAGN